MKQVIFTIALINLIFISSMGQEESLALNNKYLFEINHFITGSGFKGGIEAFFKYEPDNKKNLGIGLYFCPELKKLAGISIHHERLIGYKNPGQLFTPYAFYNLIYRKTTTNEVLVHDDRMGDLVTYSSMEHHLGLGARLKLSPTLYVKFDTGYGVYLGSIKKPSEPNPVTGEVTGSNGFGIIVKAGLGFSL